MGFIVLGYYNSEVLTNVVDINYCGNLDELIVDARNGKIDRIYIAMNMQEEAKIKENCTAIDRYNMFCIVNS